MTKRPTNERATIWVPVKLRYCMASRRLTQRELARQVHMSEIRLSRWLSRRVIDPPQSYAKRIAEVLGVNRDWLWEDAPFTDTDVPWEPQ